MDSSPFSVRPTRHGDGDETGGESFDMPKFNMGDYNTSGLMDNLSLSGSPGIRRNYEESNLLDDDSYEIEMRQARDRNGADDEDLSVVDDADVYEGEEDQTILRATDVHEGTTSGEGGSSTQGAKSGGGSNSADAQRDERLRAALFELKKMNSVFENYASALEASRHHNEVSIGSITCIRSLCGLFYRGWLGARLRHPSFSINMSLCSARQSTHNA